MDEQARVVLMHLLEGRRRDLVKDSLLLEGMLLTAMSGYQRELNVLLNALNEDVPSILINSKGKTDLEDTIQNLAAQLSENLSLREDAAWWAVESWAVALGLVTHDLPSFEEPYEPVPVIMPSYSGGARQLKTRQGIEVFARPEGSAPGGWELWGRTPGMVPLPGGYEFYFKKIACDDRGLLRLAADLAAAGSVTGLGLETTRCAEERLIQFLSQPFLVGLRELELSSRNTTDAILEAVAGLFPVLNRFKPGSECFITDRGLRALQSLTHLQSLDLGRCRKITDEGLNSLQELTELRDLCLAGLPEITDIGLMYLRDLPALYRLDLSNCHRISDAGLSILAQYPALSELDLSLNTEITDAGLWNLAPSQSLLSLRLLHSDRVTTAGWKALETYPALEDLDLAWLENLSDAALESFSRIRHLQRLRLFACKGITDAGLAYLTELPDLRELELDGSDGITDAGLVGLRALSNLSSLKISSSQISDEGIIPLAQALPNLKRLWLTGSNQHITASALAQIRRPGMDLWAPRVR